MLIFNLLKDHKRGLFIAIIAIGFTFLAIVRPNRPVGTGHAQPTHSDTIAFPNGTDYLSLGNKVDIAEDEAGKLTIADLTNSKSPVIFHHDPRSVPNYGYSSSAYWLRFNLKNETKLEKLFLELAFPPMQSVQLFEETKRGHFKVTETGKLFPVSSRPIDHRNYVFPIEIHPNQQKMIYMRLKTMGAVQIPLHLYTRHGLDKITMIGYMGYAAYYGIILMMALYNLFLFFSIKDRSYLMYVFYILGLGFSHSTLSGIAYQWLWPDSTEWNKVSTVVLVGFTLAMLILFTKYFLGTKQNSPRINKLLSIALFPSVALSLDGYFFYGQIPIRTAGLMGAVIPLLVVMAGFACVRKGNRAARYFLAALGTFVSGTLIYALKDLGIYPSGFFAENAMVFGSAIEIAILSLGLADRINALEIENERNRALSQLGAQVAHDIRSPLYALSHAMANLTTIPEEPRVLIRSAIDRITDIAHNLLEKQNVGLKNDSPDLKIQRGLLPSLVESVVSEKRTQFRSNLDLEISFKLSETSYGIFVRVIPSDLKRVISNVLNNAIEAISSESGSVSVEITSLMSEAVITIKDNGRGIPREVLANVFEEGFSFQKKSGSGLGLFHARTTLAKYDGRINISSEVGRGTTVSISLPCIQPVLSGQPPHKMGWSLSQRRV